MDNITANQSRLSDAKVFVQIDIDKSIPDSIDVLMPDGEIIVVFIEVPWMPSSCSYCKVFGHSEVIILRSQLLK